MCDYGLARFLNIGERAETVVGTYEYLTPEQCRHDPYDHSVDIWAVGVVLYEMCYGFFPFESREPEGTYEHSRDIMNKIMHKNVQFPFQPVRVCPVRTASNSQVFVGYWAQRETVSEISARERARDQTWWQSRL